MAIKELPLSDCNKFWGNQSDISAFEKFKILSVTGGVPRYLEFIKPKLSAEENIKLMCFTPGSPLVAEFKYIFNDIYGKKSETYKRIVYSLADAKVTREELIKSTNLHRGGDVTEYLDSLEVGGFIANDHTWSIRTHLESILSYYRLKDNYTRFYLKYIEPNLTKIAKEDFEDISINHLPGWNTILGLQFENLVINNHKKLIELLRILGEDLIMANPFFQRHTTRQPGCQIDYSLQTKHDIVFACEIKFNREPLGKGIITEMKEKLARLKVPKYISKRAVLIHVNGVSDEVLDADYFYEIIDFGQLLK